MGERHAARARRRLAGGPDPRSTRRDCGKLVDAAEAALAAGARDQKEGRRKASFLLALEGDGARLPAQGQPLRVARALAALAAFEGARRAGAGDRARGARHSRRRFRSRPAKCGAPACSIAATDWCRWLPDATDLLRVWSEALRRQRIAPRVDARARRADPADARHRRRSGGPRAQQLPVAPGREPRTCWPSTSSERDCARALRRAIAFLRSPNSIATSRARPPRARMRFLRAYARGEPRGGAALVARDRRLRSAARAARRGALERAGHAIGASLRRARARRRRRRRGGDSSAAERRSRSCGRCWSQGSTDASCEPAEHCFVRRIEAADDASHGAPWGFAQALHQRRLMPEPLALLRSRDARSWRSRAARIIVPLAEAPAAGAARGAGSRDRSAARHRCRSARIAGRRLRVLAGSGARRCCSIPTPCEPGRSPVTAGSARGCDEVAERLLG